MVDRLELSMRAIKKDMRENLVDESND
jgi:hypothetical protein